MNAHETSPASANGAQSRLNSPVLAAFRDQAAQSQDADDLVQEALVRLATYEREHAVERPEAFLTKAALYLSIDANRTRNGRGEVGLLEDAVIIEMAPGAEDVPLSPERLARLSDCVARLSGETRNIFLAHRLDGLSYREIGRLHSMSTSSVEKHVVKAALLITAWMEGW
jgi:RNA polymerase sigma-70 factor (ECF subfamily)